MTMSSDDQRSLHLLESLTRHKGERYETGLLWRHENINLPDNKSLAERRLRCLQKRMDKDPELKSIMEHKIAEYVSKEYIRKLTEDELRENHPRIWYLPIFPITNHNKPGKVRIVWDAAAAIHGVSLNSTLLVGPDNLTTLLSILFKFREHQVAVGGDIREIFHQILMRKEDQNCQRFLWHDDQGKLEPSVYIMRVMTFGACTTTDELRPSALFHLTIHEAIITVDRYSTWRRSINVTAYVFRFVTNLRRKRNGQSCINGPPSNYELQWAERHQISQAQYEVYPDELAILSTNAEQTGTVKRIPKSSALFRLTPFIDENGILRMTGRTGACEVLNPETRNPIILPPKHYITTLIIRHYHTMYHHQNHEIIINELRQRYSIAKIRSSYARVRRSCQLCKNISEVPQPPAMAALPPGRLAAFTRPFTHVGVDFFRPMEVSIGRRTEKRWGVLLTCLTIRAIHLELANSLSTSSCIIALRNFIARRGTPAVFYSDRGTNFVGTNRELKEAMAAINNNALMEEFTTSDTVWTFNPPASPHMGGSWERLVQSVKKNLAMMRTTRRPSEEELRNALIEVEGTLNSRPLTHVPIDEVSAPALTPNHFLIGSSDGFKPLTLLDDSAASLRRCWQISQTMANQFWKRWIRDYLPEITRRTKWHYAVKPIDVGDVVVIVDPDHPRNCWPKGRVIATVNKDGQVRRATVQTAKGVYERPAVKLAVLDVEREIK